MAFFHISGPMAKAMRAHYKARGRRRPSSQTNSTRRMKSASNTRHEIRKVKAKRKSIASPRKDQLHRPQHRPLHASLDLSVAAGQLVSSDTARTALEDLLNSPINFIPATKRTFSLSAQEKRKPKMSGLDVQQLPMSYGRNFASLQSRGMNNRGNYCYRNGVVQSLLHMPKLLAYLQHEANSHAHGYGIDNECIACIFTQMADAYWQSPFDARKLERTIACFDHYLNRWWPQTYGAARNDQQDACEMYGWLISQLEQALPPQSFRALFGINLRIRSAFKRNDCGCTRFNAATHNTAEGLHLNIQNPRRNLTFNDYLAAFFSDDIPSKSCDYCGRSDVDAVQLTTIVDAPEILKINLSRVDWDMRVVGDRINIPLWVDLSRWADNEADRAEGSIRYKLMSVVRHSGRTGSYANNGHYVASVTGPSGVALCNDQRISPVKLGALTDYKTLPYVMLYQRVPA